jgi:hypothetical protein
MRPGWHSAPPLPSCREAPWRGGRVRGQGTMFDPPINLGLPFVTNLYTDPREQKPTKDNPLIPMGTPDPYRP